MASKARKVASRPQRITRRIVSTKRHTTGYVVGGKQMTVAQTRKLVELGQVAGVRVVGTHIQSENGRKRLLDLPTTVE